MMSAHKMIPLFEKDRPSWEIKFADASQAVMSVMPGESNKTFCDPITNKSVKWEQDVFCPAFTVFNGLWLKPGSMMLF